MMNNLQHLAQTCKTKHISTKNISKSLLLAYNRIVGHLTLRQEQLGIETYTIRLVDDPLCVLHHIGIFLQLQVEVFTARNQTIK